MEGLDFVEVALVADDEFEDGLGEGSEVLESGEIEAEFFVDARVGEFGGVKILYCSSRK